MIPHQSTHIPHYIAYTYNTLLAYTYNTLLAYTYKTSLVYTYKTSLAYTYKTSLVYTYNTSLIYTYNTSLAYTYNTSLDYTQNCHMHSIFSFGQICESEQSEVVLSFTWTRSPTSSPQHSDCWASRGLDMCTHFTLVPCQHLYYNLYHNPASCILVC